MQEKAQLLKKYEEMLLKWNKIHSLSGAKDIEGIRKNITSSLYPLELEALHLEDKKLLLDVGSGNGFPAIPLGIMLGIKTILCEPNVKKASFLQNIKASLQLENFSIVRKKVENLELTEMPDLITSRATFAVNVLLQKCNKHISKKTLLLLYKGQDVKKEIPNNLAYMHFFNPPFMYLAILGENL